MSYEDNTARDLPHNEAILMSTHSIHFHDKKRKKSLHMCFLELLEEF